MVPLSLYDFCTAQQPNLLPSSISVSTIHPHYDAIYSHLLRNTSCQSIPFNFLISSQSPLTSSRWTIFRVVSSSAKHERCFLLNPLEGRHHLPLRAKTRYLHLELPGIFILDEALEGLLKNAHNIHALTCRHP